MIAYCIGNGPSLTPKDLDFLSDNMGPEDASFASNYIDLIYPETYWRPNYWVTVETPNFYPLMQHLAEGYRCYLTTNRADKVEKVRPAFREQENLSYLPPCDHGAQFKKEGKHPPNEMRFGESGHPVCLYGGSGTTAIQLAILGGFNPIVLLGHDGLYTRESSHFIKEYNEGTWPEWLTPEIRTATLMDAHEKLSVAAKKRDVKIINCTVGGILEMYPRMSLEEFMLR